MPQAKIDESRCRSCGKTTHIDDLDAKPEKGDGENSNWTRLECGDCYGPGYLSNRVLEPSA